MNKAMYQAINDAVKENADPEIALLQKQSEIFNDPQFGSTWAMAKPPYVEIPGIPEGGLASFENMFDSFGILKDESFDLQKLEVKYGQVRNKIFTKHGLDSIVRGKYSSQSELTEAIRKALPTALGRRRLMRDFEALDQQKQRYTTMSFGPAGRAAAEKKATADKSGRGGAKVAWDKFMDTFGIK